jgi:hypothetical protein
MKVALELEWKLLWNKERKRPELDKDRMREQLEEIIEDAKYISDEAKATYRKVIDDMDVLDLCCFKVAITEDGRVYGLSGSRSNWKSRGQRHEQH